MWLGRGFFARLRNETAAGKNVIQGIDPRLQ